MNRLKLHLFLLTWALATVVTAAANDLAPLPVDTLLRYGRLDNGFTYYLRHNNTNPGHAEFWLVQRVGSVMERDDQRGIAHYLEHMAFTGTERFPGDQIINYLQDNGVSYGGEINASTGFDDTRYQFSNVPVTRAPMVDSVLLMLRDMAHDLTLTTDAIERQRDIIIEEMRSNSDYQMRLYDYALPRLLNGSAFAHRIPIGDLMVISTADRAQLREFLDQWHRPDRQALIVVGDIDTGELEGKVRQWFSTLEGKSDPSLPAMTVPPHAGINYALFTDPEANSTMVSLFFQHDALPRDLRNTRVAVRRQMLNALVVDMLTTRVEHLTATTDCPAEMAGVFDHDFLVMRDPQAFGLVAMSKAGQAQATFDLLVTEALRAARHGFLPSEFARAQANERRVLDNMLNEYGKIDNVTYVNEYVDHFHNGNYIPGIPAEYALDIEQLDRITLRDVNAHIASLVLPDNVSVLITGPESSAFGYPSALTVIGDFNRIMHGDIAPFVEDNRLRDAPLLRQRPTAGRITGSVTDTAGVTTLTLSNGVNVMVKVTDNNNDNIMLGAVGTGGRWLWGADYVNELRCIDPFIEMCPLGGHTPQELRSMLAGKQVSLVYQLNDVGPTFAGQCGSGELEVLLQLLHLYFTDLAGDRAAFERVRQSARSQIAQEANNPMNVFGDSVSGALHNNNPLEKGILACDPDSLDLGRMMQIYRSTVSNAGAYTLVLVGNIDIDTLKPLLEQYVASLPDDGRREPPGTPTPLTRESRNVIFTMPMLNPKAVVFASTLGDRPYSINDERMMRAVEYALQSAMSSYLREELHGTYGVEVNCVISRFHDRWMFNSQFETAVSQADNMIAATDLVVKAVADNGISQQLFDSIKSMLIKEHQAELKTNVYWAKTLMSRAQGLDYHTGYDRWLDALTKEQVNDYIKQLRPDTWVKVVMLGEAAR